jgi:hypothetical protein
MHTTETVLQEKLEGQIHLMKNQNVRVRTLHQQQELLLIKQLKK